VPYNTRNKKIYHCFYCGAGIYFDETVRSEKTNKRLPLNLEDSTKHECAAFYSVNNRAGRAQGKQLFFGK
jgi:predicted nucleic acid-binding Zn ribbon protein